MSRRHRKQNDRRDTTDIANRRLPFVDTRQDQFLRTIEDRRQWHPEGRYAPARDFGGVRHRLRARLPVKYGLVRSVRRFQGPSRIQMPTLSQQLPYAIQFQKPKKVIICERRRIRERVLHALRKTGRVGQRRPRWTYYSKVSC